MIAYGGTKRDSLLVRTKGSNGSDNLHPNSVDHLQGPVFLILSVKLQMAYRSDKNNL